MTPFLQLALALAIIILAAKLGGYVSYRLGQPAVLGELLVGIILGPTLLDLLHLPYFSDEHLAEIVHELAEIGVLLLMFIAGLGLHISDLAKSRPSGHSGRRAGGDCPAADRRRGWAGVLHAAAVCHLRRA